MPHIKHNVLFLRGLRDDGIVQAIRVIENNRLVYNCDGSCNVFDHVETHSFGKTLITLDHNPTQNINLPEVAAVFNQISDPDTHRTALSKAAELCNSLKGIPPCINHPDRIARLTRNFLFEALSGMEGVIAPQTVRLKPENRQAIYDAIAAMNSEYPFIIRLCGKHGGRSMMLLEDQSGLAMIDNAYIGNDCYLTRYIDYADENGIYAKYRLAVIAGEPCLRHLIFSDNWMIHSGSRSGFMQNNSWYFDYEKKAIENFEADWKPRIRNAVKRIHEALKLDYFGIDCAITPENELILFEANPNMNILINTSPTPNIWEAPIKVIRQRIESMIMDRLNA